MGDIAIRVNKLGKEYRIGGPQERYRTLRDSVTEMFTAPFRRANALLHGKSYGAAGLDESIWALKDVSFEVKRGEVVGIIGRNGAGKSTLLKILSRITEPTEGYADIYGRVGALLEVGTGFHPELTGRENIYLNGAILGMSRAEIDRKFDEIVAFAEVERFIDTPVKHYSSGMGLRLGFAVAAHMEPEILVVDEVLAVGDAEFQAKCLGKMGNVAHEGRTVLFVSHNMAAIESLCDRTLLVENGSVKFDGPTDETISQYLGKIGNTNGQLDLFTDRIGDGPVHFKQIRFIDQHGEAVGSFQTGKSLTIELSYDNADRNEVQGSLLFRVFFSSVMGDRLFVCSTEVEPSSFTSTLPSSGLISCQIPQLQLMPGRYMIDLVCKIEYGGVQRALSDQVTGAAVLDVVASDFYGTGKLPPSSSGKFLAQYKWHVVDKVSFREK
jgi:lipopolysaccharide transport system ATP-binding protein